MSHFTVLVIGADHEAALQPFHEFECTGTADQYVEDVNLTAEAREIFKKDTSSRLKAPDGSLHSFFDEHGDWRPEFSQVDPDAPSWNSSRRMRLIPEGYQEVEVPTSEVETFAEWAADYYGLEIVTLDDKLDKSDKHKFGYIMTHKGEVEHVVKRTNPNRKWDWWTVGGRWPNKLLFKDGTRGSEGVAADLDLDGMLAEQAAKAATLFDSITTAIDGRTVHSWQSVLKRRDACEFDFDSARAFYNGQDVVIELKEQEVIDAWDGADQLNGVLAAKDRAQYIERESQVNSSTWALLHDGHWTERGSMGWFATSDATDGSTLDYAINFWLTLRSLPGDARVTVVDCHI